MIETPRLILRPPEPDRDLDALAEMHADPRVMEWLSAPMDREGVAALIDRIRTEIGVLGWGFWAAERKADGRAIGLIGLLSMPEDFGPGPAVEVGWRLAFDAWGQGYASEGARAALAWGFEHIAPPEIVAITARTNLRSQAVMRKIGMTPEPHRDFDHPRVAEDSPLRPHVTFSIRR